MFDKVCVNHTTKVNVNIKCTLVAKSGSDREAKQLTGRLLCHPLSEIQCAHGANAAVAAAAAASIVCDGGNAACPVKAQKIYSTLLYLLTLPPRERPFSRICCGSSNLTVAVVESSMMDGIGKPPDDILDY